MSVLVYDCGSVENTVTAILDTESGAMIIRGNGDVDNYMNEYSPWYSEHSNITQVTVDKGITRIGSGTFYGCENLSFVEIANTVTSMGADVFQNCTSLTSIKIPKSITEIGNGTFTDSGLTEVKFYGNPPTVGTDIFDGVTADVYTPEGNEEWTETAKGTVAGNGSNLTWKTFDSKPNLIDYDELDYFWSRIKKYIQENKGGSSLPVIDDKTFIKYLATVVSDSSHVNTNTILYVSNPEYFSVNDCFYVKKDSTHFFYGIVSAVNNNTGALTYSIPASDGGTFFNPDDGQVVLNYGNPMNGGVYLDWANDRVDLYKNHTALLERDYNIYDPILNINAWDSTTASIAEENGVIDISGENNNGQAFGGVTVVKDKVIGRCFKFDIAERQAIVFNQHYDWSQPFTISFRIRPIDLSNTPCFVDTRTSEHNKNFFLGTVGSTDYRLRFVSDGTSTTYYSNNRLQLYYPTTVTITLNNNILKIYFDGVLDSSYIITYVGNFADITFFGFYNYADVANRHFTGVVSAIRVFDRELTDEEVHFVYQQSLVTPYINSNMYEPILNLDADYSTTASIAEEDGVIDVSGNHNNGQAYGGVVVNNGAYEFDGIDDVIEFSNLLQGKESLTLSVNFTFPELPSGSARFFNSFSNKSGYKGLSLYLQPDGKIGYQLFNSSQNIEFYPDFIYQPNTNYNVMLVVDGISHKVQVYKNAEKISDESFSGSLEFHTTEILRVGGFTKTQDLYKGIMTNVKIFDRALTAEEVYNVYQQSLNPEAFENPEKLISYDEINKHRFSNNSLIQDTIFRIGNLSGICGITDNRIGVSIGDDNNYIIYDKINGLRTKGIFGKDTIGSPTSPVYIDKGNIRPCDDLKYPDGEILNLNAKGLTTSSIAEVDGVIDSSGNGNHGQAFGGVEIVKDKEMGDCYSFDGTDDHLKFTNSNLLSTINNSSELTFAFRIKTSATSGRVFALNNSTSISSNQLGCFQIENNLMVFYDRLTSSDTQKSLSCDFDSDNHFIAVTVNYSEGKSYLYLDANLVDNSENWFTGNKSGVLALWIGSQGNSYFANGLISDVRIYPRALSASEIKTLYILGSKSTYAGQAFSSTKVFHYYSTENINRPLLMADLTNITTTSNQRKSVVFSNNFYANPSTGVLYGRYLAGALMIGDYQIVDLTASTYDQDTWYPCTFTLSANLTYAKPTLIDVSVGLQSQSKPDWSTHNNGFSVGFTLITNGTGWGAMSSANTIILRQNCNWITNNVMPTYYTQMSNSSTGVLWLRGGGVYNVYISSKVGLTIRTSTYTVSSQSVSPTTTPPTSATFTNAVTGGIIYHARNADSASSATNANNAKLTHTVGNTEYPLVFGSSFVIDDSQQALRIGTPTATLANCALRVKAYCAAANTQGEAFIVMGNNIAKASANNARGGLTMYGTGTYYLHIRAGDVTANRVVNLVNGTADVTLTMPSSSGTIALTSSDITGNAATATTATNANKLKSTTVANASWYGILGVLNSAASGTINDTYRAVGTNICFRNDANAATAYSRMSLGNNTASTSSASAARAGLLCLYGTNKGYANLIGPNITGGINVYMPSIGGYIPVSSDNTVRNIQKVSSLPSSPNANTMYLVTS